MIITKLTREMLWWDSVSGLKKEEDSFVSSKSEDTIASRDSLPKANGKKTKECKGTLFKCLVGHFLRPFSLFLVCGIKLLQRTLTSNYCNNALCSYCVIICSKLYVWSLLLLNQSYNFLWWSKASAGVIKPMSWTTNILNVENILKQQRL